MVSTIYLVGTKVAKLNVYCYTVLVTRLREHLPLPLLYPLPHDYASDMRIQEPRNQARPARVGQPLPDMTLSLIDASARSQWVRLNKAGQRMLPVDLSAQR
jgi:hypothetical protein